MDLLRSGDTFYPATGHDFQHLPARSRTPVYVPHGMELALPSPTQTMESLPMSAAGSAPEFWTPQDSSRSRLTSSTNTAAAGAEVNITNNTTVLVVDVPVKPIEKLKRAVKKMQRVSKRVVSCNKSSLTQCSLIELCAAINECGACNL